MEPGYWEGRWKRGETGWHQSEAEPRMVSYFSTLPATRVLVPLCGKSLDLKWLRDHGHEVIGIELAEQPCMEFFQEQAIPFRKTQLGPFTVFAGERITIYNGDFFALEPSHLVRVGAVYDRGALIALPPELRDRYTMQMIRLIDESSRSLLFHFLQIVLERTPSDNSGPPFSVSSADITGLYGTEFEVTPLSRERVKARGPSGSETDECVYDLRRR